MLAEEKKGHWELEGISVVGKYFGDGVLMWFFCKEGKVKKSGSQPNHRRSAHCLSKNRSRNDKWRSTKRTSNVEKKGCENSSPRLQSWTRFSKEKMKII